MTVADKAKWTIGDLNIAIFERDEKIEQLQAELAELKKRAETPLVIKPKKNA